MCGTTSQSDTNSSSSYSPPPDVLANYQAATQQAQNVAEQPYTSYGGQLVAGINNQQASGIQNLNNAYGAQSSYNGAGINDLNNANNMAASGYNTAASGNNLLNTGAGVIGSGIGYQGQGQNYVNQGAGLVGSGSSLVNQGAATSAGGLSGINSGYGYLNSGQGAIQTGESGISTGVGTVGQGLGYQSTAGNTIGQGVGAQGSAYNTIQQGSGDVGIGAGVLGSSLGLAGQSAQNINAQQFSPNAVSQYESPYQSDVVNSTMAEINNQNQQQSSNLTGNAIAAGAFGGDRAGVAQAALAGQQDIASNATIAGLNNQNYEQALGEFNTQQGVNLSAAQNTAARQLAASQQIANVGLGFGTLGTQQGQLGTEEGQIGLNYGTLGTQQGQVGLNYGTLGSEQGALGSQYGQLGGLSGQLGATAGQLGSEQGQIGSELTAAGTAQGQLGATYGTLGTQTGQLGLNTGTLGSQIAQVGSAQGTLGAQEGQIAGQEGTLGTQQGQLGQTAQNEALTFANAQTNAGTLQQQTQQAKDTANYNQFLQQQAYPFQTTGWLSNIVEGLGSQSGGSSTGSSETTTTGSSASQAIGGILGLGSLLARGGRVGSFARGGIVGRKGFFGGGAVAAFDANGNPMPSGSYSVDPSSLPGPDSQNIDDFTDYPPPPGMLTQDRYQAGVIANMGRQVAGPSASVSKDMADIDTTMGGDGSNWAPNNDDYASAMGSAYRRGGIVGMADGGGLGGSVLDYPGSFFDPTTGQGEAGFGAGSWIPTPSLPIGHTMPNSVGTTPATSGSSASSGMPSMQQMQQGVSGLGKAFTNSSFGDQLSDSIQDAGDPVDAGAGAGAADLGGDVGSGLGGIGMMARGGIVGRKAYAGGGSAYGSNIAYAQQIDPTKGWGDDNLTYQPAANDTFGSNVNSVTLPPWANQSSSAPAAPAPNAPVAGGATNLPSYAVLPVAMSDGSYTTTQDLGGVNATDSLYNNAQAGLLPSGAAAPTQPIPFARGGLVGMAGGGTVPELLASGAGVPGSPSLLTRSPYRRGGLTGRKGYDDGGDVMPDLGGDSSALGPGDWGYVDPTITPGTSDAQLAAQYANQMPAPQAQMPPPQSAAPADAAPSGVVGSPATPSADPSLTQGLNNNIGFNRDVAMLTAGNGPQQSSPSPSVDPSMIGANLGAASGAPAMTPNAPGPQGMPFPRVGDEEITSLRQSANGAYAAAHPEYVGDGTYNQGAPATPAPSPPAAPSGVVGQQPAPSGVISRPQSVASVADIAAGAKYADSPAPVVNRLPVGPSGGANVGNVQTDAAGNAVGSAPAPTGVTGAAPAQTAAAPSSGASVYNGLLDRGYGKPQAAALAGNIQQESSFDPTSLNTKEGAFGYLQWRGDRKQNLIDFANAQGKSPSDPNVELDFIKHEMSGSESKSAQAFLNAPDVASANAALKKYIRYGDDSQGTRLSNALAFNQGADGLSGAPAVNAITSPQQPPTPGVVGARSGQTQLADGATPQSGGLLGRIFGGGNSAPNTGDYGGGIIGNPLHLSQQTRNQMLAIGAGIMGGTSKSPLVNIGQGISQGMNNANTWANTGSEIGLRSAQTQGVQTENQLKQMQLKMMNDFLEEQAKSRAPVSASPTKQSNLASPPVSGSSTPSADPLNPTPTAQQTPLPQASQPTIPNDQNPTSLRSQAAALQQQAARVAMFNPGMSERLQANAQQLYSQANEITKTGRITVPDGKGGFSVMNAPGFNQAEGATAGARMAAEEAAKAPYELTQVQPEPGGPTMLVPKSQLLNMQKNNPNASVINPGAGSPPGSTLDHVATQNPTIAKQPEFYAEKQKAIATEEQSMLDQYRQRQIVEQRLQTLTGIMQKYQPGAFAEQKADIVASLRGIGIPVKDTDTASPAAFQEMMKNTQANVFDQAKALGGRLLVTELSGLGKSNANPEMQPEANAAILGQALGLTKYEDKHTEDYFAWKKDHPNATSTDGFELPWAKQNPVGPFVQQATKGIAYKGQEIPGMKDRVAGQTYMTPKGPAVWQGSGWQLAPAAQ